MDENMPHRRRRPRTQAGTAPEAERAARRTPPGRSAQAPVQSPSQPPPRRVRSGGTAPAGTASKPVGTGATRVRQVSDEPVLRRRPQAKQNEAGMNYVFNRGDYPQSDLIWPGEQQPRTKTPPRPAATETGSRPRTAAGTSGAAGNENMRPARPAVKHGAARMQQGYRPSSVKPRRPASSGGQPPRRRRGNSNRYVKLAIAVLAVLAVVAGLYVGGTYLVEVRNTLAQGDGVFYPNMYINDIALSGMTREQALTAVEAQVSQQMNSFSISITSTTGQSWVIDKDTLGMRYDVEEQISALWRLGHEGNADQRYRQVKQLEQAPIERYTALSYDISGLNAILTQIKQEVDRAPVNATRIADNTVFPPFAYTNDQVGYSLDISAAYTQICDMIDRLESGTVTLTPVEIAPAVTRAQLESEIEQIGYYKTQIKTGTTNEGRTMNVALGCQKFNHMTVPNGSRVSFNDVTGTRDERNGWYQAMEIAYGEYRPGYGGGICQVSSTLYNACIAAGLDIVRRSQHGLEVGYIDKGLDATVSNGGLDFIFRNNTGAEIYIEAGVETRGNNKYCVFIIYGKPNPNGYSYHLEGRIVEELPIPEPSIKEDKDNDGDGRGDEYGLVYKDETKETSKGRVGYKVDTYLVTTDSSGNVVSEEYRYTDTFKAIAPVIHTGTAYRD